MAPTEQPAATALEALLQDGTLAGSWTLDAARSTVLLNTRHSWGLRPLQVVFQQVAGSGTVTPAGEVTGVVTVTAESVDTQNARRDKHLRSADFFDIAAYPDFTFTADSATPAAGGVRIAGSLTVRDRTQPVSFDAKVTTADGEVQLDGEIPINRADFGMTWNFIGIAAMNSTIVVHAVFARQ
jgi:polyisoprenoid-binding protein YceI